MRNYDEKSKARYHVDEFKAGSLCNGVNIEPVEFVDRLSGDDIIYISSMKYSVEMKRNLIRIGTLAHIVEWKEHAFKDLRKLVCGPDYYKTIDEYAVLKWVESALNSEVTYWYQHLGALNSDEKVRLNRRKFEYQDKSICFYDGEIVLDVGCGPLPQFGDLTNTGKIVYIPVDPLAYWYKKMLDYYGYKVPVEPRFAIMENLSDTFGLNYADKVIIHNAMDHSIDVLRSFIEAFRTLKVGGKLLLAHGEAECLWEYWDGLHQWGFAVDEQEDLVVIGFDKQRIDISEMFREYADIDIYRVEVKEAQDYIYASFEKKKNLPNELVQKYDDQSFRRILIELLFSKFVDYTTSIG